MSLFVVMLAFFIMLNAMSSFDEERTLRVVKSVQSSFQLGFDVIDIESPIPVLRQVLGQEGDVLQRVEGALKSPMISAVVRRIDRGDKMVVTLPYHQFMQSISQQNEILSNPAYEVDQASAILGYMVDFMKDQDAREDGAFYRMVVFLQGDDVQTSDVDVIGDVLVAMGLPKSLLAVGIKQGDPDMIEILFDRIRPTAPQVRAVP